jgi:hypothetical protein
MGFPKPPPQQSFHMLKIPSIGNYPWKFNNNVSGVGTKFSKQVSDHITKGLPSSRRCFGNTRVYKREFVLKTNLVDAIKKGSKVFCWFNIFDLMRKLIDWKVTKNHPMWNLKGTTLVFQNKDEKINNTQRNMVKAITNLSKIMGWIFVRNNNPRSTISLVWHGSLDPKIGSNHEDPLNQTMYFESMCTYNFFYLQILLDETSNVDLILWNQLNSSCQRDDYSFKYHT